MRGFEQETPGITVRNDMGALARRVFTGRAQDERDERKWEDLPSVSDVLVSLGALSEKDAHDSVFRGAVGDPPQEARTLSVQLATLATLVDSRIVTDGTEAAVLSTLWNVKHGLSVLPGLKPQERLVIHGVVAAGEALASVLSRVRQGEPPQG